MKKIVRPVVINVIVVIVLLLIDLFINSTANTRPLPRFILSGFSILILALVNLITGMVRNRDKKGDGQYYLLIAGVLLLIGFSVCSIGLSE